MKPGVSVEFQVEELGIWTFFTNITDAIAFANAVLEHDEKYDIRCSSQLET